MFLVAAALTLPGRQAEAFVIFDNFGPNTGYSAAFSVAARSECQGSGEPGVRCGARFTVTGSSASLSSITFPISRDNLSVNPNLRVRIAADNAGRPGATIEVLSLNQNNWPLYPSPPLTLTSTSHPTLISGTNYWIVTEPSGVLTGCFNYVEYRWHANTTGATVPVIQDVESGVPADPWDVDAVPFPAAFRVEGQAPVDVEESTESLTYTLGTAGPMPFSSATTLRFSLLAAGHMSLTLYDLAGRRVRTLVDGSIGAGRARQDWDGKDDRGQAVPSGVYFARMRTAGFEKTTKLVLAR